MRAQDRADLHDLVHRYAACVDQRDFSALLGLFTPEAVLLLPDPPGTLEPTLVHTGREAIAQAMETVGQVPVTSHELAGEVFDTTGPDTATGRITGVAHHLTERGGEITDLVWHLHYVDEYLRTGHQWQISRRAVHIDFIETRPVRRRRMSG